MEITNVMGLPQPFVDAATSDHRYKEHRYSVTEVLGGTCEAILKRRHDKEITEDVSQRIWALFGTAVHDVLRRAQGTESQLQENWLSVPVVGDYELSGIFDLYDDATGTVTDYKTASIFKVKFGDFSDWRQQTLAYCWMLRESGFDARRGEIVALLKDHSKRDAKIKASEGYPPHPVFQIAWDFTDEDFEAIEDEIMHWFARVASQERVTDEQLTPCSPEQRWHKDDKWAVMRKGKKRAVKLFESCEDAEKFVEWLEDQPSNKGKKLYIEFRQGEDTKCAGYCPVAQFCPHGRKIVGE